MRRLCCFLMAAMLLSLMVSVVAAQSKMIPGEMTVVKGTVEAIDHSKKVITLKDSKGKFVTVDVPEGTERFAAVKVGDAVSLRYYDNVVVRLKQPGEKDVDTESGAVTPVAGAKPAGTAATQRTITARIEAIDLSVPSITFVGPNNWKYSRRVQDKKTLEKVKVGDKVDITWTTAVIVDVQAGKK